MKRGPGETPGPPIIWSDPQDPEDAQPGYGYIPDETTDEETFFYHSDHLGSTSYITDDKGNITQYTAYLPYGELLVDEHSSSEDLPYKFNGKELDDETGLYYYGARYLNPISSVFLNTDRYRDKYPGLSAYSYCAGNPINAIDVNGDSIWITYKGNDYLYQSGGLYNRDGSAYEGKVKGFLSKSVNALNSLAQTAVGAAMISELQSSTNSFTIKSSSKNRFKASSLNKAGANLAEIQAVTGNARGSNGSGGIIYWNAHSTFGGLDVDGNTSRPAFIGLGHEMAHASDANQGLLHYGSYEKGKVNPSSFKSALTGKTYHYEHNGLLKSEWRAVYRENLIRAQVGIPLREYYGIDMSSGRAIGIGPRLLTPSNQPINY